MTVQEAINHPRPAKLKVGDFLLLDRAGAFSSYAKTELIGGTIVVMNAQHRPHARSKGLLFRRLEDALIAAGSALEVLVEASVEMPPIDMPEPDLVVTSEPEGDGPVPLASVALLVEVSDTTVATDLGAKAQLYAASGVPEYWVVDLPARAVHQFWEPGAEGYAKKHSVPLGQRLDARTIAGVALDTNGI